MRYNLSQLPYMKYATKRLILLYTLLKNGFVITYIIIIKNSFEDNNVCT